jgi:hypothetical protein
MRGGVLFLKTPVVSGRDPLKNDVRDGLQSANCE